MTLVHKELKNEDVHAASVTIAGAIEPGAPMDPDLIADPFCARHAEPAST